MFQVANAVLAKTVPIVFVMMDLVFCFSIHAEPSRGPNG